MWQNDQTLALEKWDMAAGVEKPISRCVTAYNGVQLTFSPDGRRLFVVCPWRDLTMPGPTLVLTRNAKDFAALHQFALKGRTLH